MKIALYAGMFKQDQDGATKTLYELTDTLLKNEIKVGVWGFSITPQEKKGLDLFKIFSLPIPLYPEYKLTIPNPKLKAQLREFDPDLLHITVPDMTGIFLMRLARRMGIPVLTSFHTDFPSYLESYHLNLLYKPAWRYFKWFYNKSQRVLAPTDEIIQKLDHYGISNTKLWSRGIHLNRYNPDFRSTELRKKWKAENKKVILYSGRFVWYKDLETFIGVYELFKKHGPDNVTFVLAGDGPIREELERRMPDAIYPGYLHGEELSRVYASSDIFLFPSTTETFGNVVLEGLASGLPAVVSDVGGCQEIVENADAGMAVKAKAPQLFYESCKRLVEDKSYYERCRQNGLKYAKAHSWNAINGRVIAEYQEMISNNNQGKQIGTPVLANH